MNRHFWHACDRSAGFSLVELLVTIIIAAIAFAAMVPVFVGASQKASGDKMRNIALNVAQDRMEKIRQLDFDQITQANLESSSFAGGQFGTTWTTYSGGSAKVFDVAYDLENQGGSGAMPAYVRVRVTVTWTPPPGPVKPVELQTYVSRQYAGPQITNLELAPLSADGEIITVPLSITATVALGDRASTAKVAFYIFGQNGMLVKQTEVMTGAIGNTSPGVYSISWDAAGAGDGTYSFRAQAYLANDDVGNTWARSATLNLTNGILPVTNLTVTPGDGTLTLSWDEVYSTKFAHFELWRGDTSGGEVLIVDDLTANGYTDTGLVNGQTYYYVVYAINKDDVAGPASNEVSEEPGLQTDVTPPTVPGDFDAEDSNYSAVLSWLPSTDLVEPATGVAGYYVYRSDNPTAPLTTLSANADTVTDEIGWEKTFSYCVQAFDGAGNLSAKTAWHSVTTEDVEKKDFTVKALQNTVFKLESSFPTTYSKTFTITRRDGKKTVNGLPLGKYTVTATYGGVTKTQDVVHLSNDTVTFTFP